MPSSSPRRRAGDHRHGDLAGCAARRVLRPPNEGELRIAAAGGTATDARSRRSGAQRNTKRAPTTRASAASVRVVSGDGRDLFGFGLLLSFTPCVLPCAILSGVIIGSGGTSPRPRVPARRGLRSGMASYICRRRVAAGLSGAMLAAARRRVGAGALAAIFVRSPWRSGRLRAATAAGGAKPADDASTASPAAGGGRFGWGCSRR